VFVNSYQQGITRYIHETTRTIPRCHAYAMLCYAMLCYAIYLSSYVASYIYR